MILLSSMLFALMGITRGFIVDDGGVQTTQAPGSDYKCPDTYILNEIDGTCIKLFERPHMSYHAALEVCKEVETGHLAQPQAMESNKFIAGMLARRTRYWIGAMIDEGNVLYSNGDPVPFQAPWAIGEPNNHRGNEKCVEIIGNKRGAWNDKRCSRKRPFVCQAKATKKDNADSLSVYDIVSCNFEDRCHYEQQNNWTIAISNNRDYLDHTTNSTLGHYLTSFNTKSVNVYKTPVFNISTEMCLKYYFDGRFTHVQSEKGQRDITNFLDIDREPWKLSFSSLKPSGDYTDINTRLMIIVGPDPGTRYPYAALDDIELTPGKCHHNSKLRK